MEQGIVLTGGGAQLDGIDRVIMNETQISVIIAENPLDCVAIGTGRALDSLDILKKIVNEVSVPVQIGGGIRKVDYAKELLDLDIERVIIGTMGIMHPETLTLLADEYGSDRIMVSLDSKNDKVVVKGWKHSTDKSPQELSNTMKEHGAGSILFTNVDVEGLLGGFYVDPVIDLVTSVDIPVVYSGGVTSLDDLKQLQTTGAKGVVIGSALYKDKINLADALKYQDIK